MELVGMTEEKGVDKYLRMLNDNNSRFAKALFEAESKINNLVITIRNIDGDVDREKNKIYKKLYDKATVHSTLFKKIIKEFCEEYKLTFPSDGKCHSAEIANALHIIDMLGNELDLNSLNNILSPLTKDYKSLKTVCDVILVKANQAIGIPVVTAQYSSEVVNVVRDYLGENTGMHDYYERMDFLKSVWENPARFYSWANLTPHTAKVKLESVPSYTVLSAPGWLKEAAEIYERIKKSDFFMSMMSEN